MNDDRRRAILAEIAKWAEPDGLQLHQFTTKHYMEDHPEIGRSKAQMRLNGWEKTGLLRSAMVTHIGKRVKAYWRPEDEPKEA
jgi:hypothetical protein